METNWTRWTKVVSQPKFHQFWFERVDIDFWYDFADLCMVPAIILGVSLYLFAAYHLKEYMKDKKPLKLRKQLFLWNVLVGLFSITALSRATSEMGVILRSPNGFYRSFCTREEFHMSTAFWTVLIVFSRPFFVVDTAFLILRKKTIDAVHIIHHSFGMIVHPVIAYLTEPVVGWFALANLFTHAVHYPLLALRALDIHVPKARHIMVGLEIVQFIFVLLVSAYTEILRASGTYCLRHPISIMVTYTACVVLLIFVVITILSPEYWKRGQKAKTYHVDSKKAKIL